MRVYLFVQGEKRAQGCPRMSNVRFTCRNKAGFVSRRASVPVSESGPLEIAGGVVFLLTLGAVVFFLLAL